MSKRKWLLVYLTVLIVFGVDQLSKTWALNHITQLEMHGFWGLVLHRNPGAILGTFANLPPLLRVVSLSTAGAFLIFLFGILQYLLPKSLMVLRLGMSILLGGILGNVWDRMHHGAVIDFLLLRFFGWTSPAFNVADALQWVGYILVVYILLTRAAEIWPDKNNRRIVWINPSFQLKYCFILSLIGLSFSIISGVFSYSYLQITIDDLVFGSPKMMEQRFLVPFFQTYVIMTLVFLVGLFVLGRILSHRIAGPLYAFERYLDDLLEGKERELKLRAGDEFKHLEEVAEKIREKLHQSKNAATEAPAPSITTENAPPESD
jgi:signal peptidase II